MRIAGILLILLGIAVMVFAVTHAHPVFGSTGYADTGMAGYIGSTFLVFGFALIISGGKPK